MNNAILDQLARNTNLLPDDLSAAILAGNVLPIEDLALYLVTRAIDAHAVINNDKSSSWNERRIACSILAAAFLAALATVGDRDA